MKECFYSYLTRLIANKEDSIVLSPGSWVYAASPQTPVFKGEERDYLKEIKGILLTLLSSQAFLLALLGIGIVITMLILYNRRKSIPDLELKVLEKDTWFITRDDNNRVGIVVSVTLRNKATRGASIVDCKLSGYSAREHPGEVHLVGPDGKQKLNFPEHKHFSKSQGFYLRPYSTENVWFYYESRTVTMRNLLQAPLTIRNSDRKRKTIRVNIPRHDDQISIYRDMASIW